MTLWAPVVAKNQSPSDNLITEVPLLNIILKMETAPPQSQRHGLGDRGLGLDSNVTAHIEILANKPLQGMAPPTCLS